MYLKKGIIGILFAGSVIFTMAGCDLQQNFGAQEVLYTKTPDSLADTTIIEITDLREEHGFIVAWDINDSGEIAGGNSFLNSNKEMIEMGSIFARSMNNNGQVVGNKGQQAILWDQQNGIVELGMMDGNRSEAHDINNQGQVVGEIVSEYLVYEDEEYGDVYDYEFKAFVWDPDNKMNQICKDGWANGINDHGQVVGVDYSLSNRLFLWDSENGNRGFGSEAGYSSGRANAINNAGQVTGSILVAYEDAGKLMAGNSNRGNNQRGSIKRLMKITQADGIYDPVHVLEMIRNSTFEQDAFPWESEPVSHFGDMNMMYGPDLIGTAGAVTYRSEAFIWDEENGVTSLGTLGGDWSTAWDINDHGQVVGYSSLEPGSSRAFLWDNDYGMIELPTLGGNSLARAINNDGKIVGYSYDADGKFYPVMWDIVNLAH